jgi:hypothetical protein
MQWVLHGYEAFNREGYDEPGAEKTAYRADIDQHLAPAVLVVYLHSSVAVEPH